MAREKKAKEHKFLNKHTVLGVFLLMYFNFVLIDFVFGAASAVICEHAGIDNKTGLGAGAIIGSILALIIWFRFFSPEYKWKPESGSGAISLSSFLAAIMAGAGEEVAFREVGISYMARQWNDENKIILMAIIPAAAFALTHITNIVSMSLSDVLKQALLTFFMGVFLGAVYIRTGNIWPIILGHSLHDIMAFSASEKLSMLGLNLPDWSVTLLTVIEAGLLISGLYMLRKSKRAEIIALWDKRWSRDTVVSEEA